MRATKFLLFGWLLVGLGGLATTATAGDFDTFLQPLLARKCVKCHGGEQVNGEVNFQQITSVDQFRKDPKLIQRAMQAIDANDMPPEGELPLNDRERQQLLSTLKTMLQEAAATDTAQPVPLRRLNRFQYNNSLRDIFQLNRDVFALPEKLMTRRDNYLQSGADKVPDRVNVASLALQPTPGLSEVRAFPKDLRAEHGFDNQASQLTLSPLLLDAFLRLSVSIIESPDFTEQNVGIWKDLFQPPSEEVDMRTELKRRLAPFLTIAFRRPVADETLQRYVEYTLAKLEQGLSFTDSMKRVASAALSSPMFLYRTSSQNKKERQYELASDLSFFLWASCPDAELLRLAERGELARPEVLQATLDRMLADPKIERFLDSFPTQWMQLENVLAATPDPDKNRFFSLDKKHPASLQMVLEPLLLFDAVFVEDRPIAELIAPTFHYQSEFLSAWYNSDLKPPAIDHEAIVKQNHEYEQRRKELQVGIKKTEAELAAVVERARERTLAASQENAAADQPVDLKPYAAWEFNGDLKDSIHGLDLTAHGKVQFQDGLAYLDKSYLLSKKLPIELRAKTLEVWCQVPNLDQAGGGLMGIQGDGDFFDTIVMGERQSRHWISGSNGFSRTNDFPESTPETNVNEPLHLAMVYAEDGTTTLFRDGQPYGKSYRKGQATFPQGQSAVIFGLRHLPPGGNKYLTVRLDKARLYDRALSAEEVAALASGDNSYVSEKDAVAALTGQEKANYEALHKHLNQSTAALKLVPPTRDPNKAKQESQKWFDDDLRNKLHATAFERAAVSDPRYGGVITNAAVLSMTSGPQRTHPIARGAWVIEVIFNDPPDPPPNDVPPLNEQASSQELTIREKFAAHRENPSCAGCHARLDPLGFALENYDITGRWRDEYENGREVDASGTLMRKYDFDGIVRFKAALVEEQRRFAKAFTAHLLRFALARELRPADTIAIDVIMDKTEKGNFKIKSLIREVVLSNSFRRAN